MSQVLRFCSRVAFLALAAVCVFPQTARAGKEILTVVCGAPTGYDTQTNTAMVPVTITLVNGQPDTIDMTYSATGSGSCDPQTSQVSLIKGTPVIQNVAVSYTGMGSTDFTASGVGEAFDADSDSSTISLNFPRGPKPITITLAATKVPATPRRFLNVPVLVELPKNKIKAGAVDPQPDFDKLHISYGASGHEPDKGTHILPRKPDFNDAYVTTGHPSQTNFIADITDCDLSSIGFGVAVSGQDPNHNFAFQISYADIDKPNPPKKSKLSDNGSVQITLGQVTTLHRWLYDVTVSSDSDTLASVKLKFFAVKGDPKTPPEYENNSCWVDRPTVSVSAGTPQVIHVQVLGSISGADGSLTAPKLVITGHGTDPSPAVVVTPYLQP